MDNKKILRPTFIGFFLLLASLLITGLVGINDSWMNGGTGILNGKEVSYGLRAAIKNYFLCWRPAQFQHETAYIGLVLILVAAVVACATIILALAKKKPVLMLTGLFLGAAIAYLPFVFILVVPMIQMGVLGSNAMLVMAGVTGLVLFAIYFLYLPVGNMLRGVLDSMAGKKKDCCKNKKGMEEEAVRNLVKEGLDAHVEEYHSEEEPAPAPAPVEKEPEPQPEPEEEPEEAEEEAADEAEEEGEEAAPEADGNGGLVIKGKKRRASFETRLRNSEFDLRHKYYDLRDYIKWYGLRNRVSIPGDTFSYKRQRYVFVTIIGKHIRVYLNLNPNDYADSTIPVEPSAAKKYEDLPCLLRVKSDLSYRRAKKLVDDLMQKIGMDKPDTDEPKETQKDE